MTMSIKSLLTGTASAACIALGAANAQSVDYSTLQQTFGEPVTTSATGKPQRASEVPADMVIITQDQIRRSGATNLVGVLKFVPGLDVREYGNADAEVNVHGYLQPYTPRLLVLVNGRQVYLDHYGLVSWSSIPVQLPEIQQIEIVKGPGSSLFGFNAVSGVINIITINPQNTQKASLSASAGSFGLVNLSGVVAQQLTDTLSLKASGGYSAQKTYHVAAGVGVPVNPQAENAALELRWQATDKIEVRGEGTWAKSRQFELVAPGGFTNVDYNLYSYKAGIAADTAIGVIDLSAYRNHMTAKMRIYGMPATVRNDVTVISASDLFKVFSNVTVRLATEYRDNGDNAFMTIPAAKTRIVAGSGMIDWAITPELSWTNSARIDAFSLSINHVDHSFEAYSWNSGLVWRLGQDDTFRLLGGRSIQTPSLVLSAMVAAGSAPALKPSPMEKVQLSWDHSFPDIASKLHVSLYRQWYADLLTMAYTNVGNSKSDGVEVAFDGASADGWRWNLSLNARSVADNMISNIMTNPRVMVPLNVESTTPKYVGTIGAGKTWGDFEFDIAARWQSKTKDWAPMQFTHSFVKVPAYISFTGRIGYKITDNFTVALTADQFNKETLFEGAGVPDKRRFMITLTSSL